MTENSAVVRVGFIGAGGIAAGALAPATHAAKGAVLQAVAARSLQRAQALEPAGRSYDDYAALIADPDVDLVYISLDNAGHLPWTLAALEAGKHVLCEKPLALDPAGLETMIEAAERNDRLLVEAFWYRWHPRTRRLEQLVEQGALGPVLQVETDFSFDQPDDGDPAQVYRLNPERGGGAIYDVGCYAISSAHLALGGQLQVTSATTRLGPTGVDVEATATLVTPPEQGPATAVVHCGISAPDRQVISVRGAGARVDFGYPAYATLNVPVELTITTPDATVRQEQFAPSDAYQLMVEAVAARIRGEDAFLPGLEHSRQVAATTAAVFGLSSSLT